jgi:hypothetical protein
MIVALNTCLIYTMSMHFPCENNINPSIHVKYVECNCFPCPSKFKMYVATLSWFCFMSAYYELSLNHLTNFLYWVFLGI